MSRNSDSRSFGCTPFSLILNLLFVGIFVPSHVAAQPRADQHPHSAGSEPSALWNWSAAKPHHAAVTMIRTGEAIGTGVVILVDEASPEGDGFLGFVATAAHVVESAKTKGKGEEIRIYFANKNRDVAKNCSIVRRDREQDVAVLWAWIPKDVLAARLTSRSAKAGDAVEFVGFGGKSSLSEGLRHFSAKASAPTDSKLIYADQVLLPGDSGGPIFDSKNRLIGIISGGWFWWSHSKMRTQYDEPLRATWPARGSNILPLARLIASLPRDEVGRCSASKSKRSKFKKEDGELVATLSVPRQLGAVDFGPTAPPLAIESVVEWVPEVEGQVIYETRAPEEVIIYESLYPGTPVEYSP